MRSECTTGKKCFDTKDQADQALINIHALGNFRAGSGPIAVYQCEDCNYWHFTSKGNKSSLLDDPEVKDHIKKTQQSRFWEDKLGM